MGDEQHPPNATHVERRLTYIEEVFVGLQFLHRNDIIHCDIKPDNILLHSRSGRPEDAYAVITDFGLSVLKGQPIIGHYPAFGLYPRQHPADENQDFYALVMTLYCLYHPDVYGYVEKMLLKGLSRAHIDKELRTKIPALVRDTRELEQTIPAFPFRLAAFAQR